MLMEEVIVLQLTPKVHKDPYLFVSRLKSNLFRHFYTDGRKTI